MVLPLVVIAVYVAVLGAPEVKTKDPTTLRFEKTLAIREPDVILLGASKLSTDIDRAALTAALDLPKDAVASLGWSGTTAPLWYAIAENRVFRAGHRPKLIIVYSTFDWTLSVTVGELQRGHLLTQLGDEEPVLDQKVLGRETSNPTLARVLERKGSVRDHLTGWLRDITVGLLFAEPGEEGLREAGRATATPALETLFGLEAGVDLSKVKRAIPVAEAARVNVERPVAHVEDTLIPDFIDLVQAHGSRIVFVHAPVRANVVGQYQVDPALLRETLVYLNAHGAGYLDLQALRLPDTAFGDANHLNRNGRDQLTSALAAGLKEINALGDGPIQPTKLRAAFTPPVITRDGAGPALTAGPPKRGPNTCDWTIAVPALERINDLALNRAQLGMVSPIVLLEDGQPLRPHATPPEFNDACTGAFQHQGRVVKFSPTGANAEAASTHAYTLGLSPDLPLRDATRHEAYWVYPGTTLRFSFPEGYATAAEGAAPAGPASFGVSVTALSLGGTGATVRITSQEGEIGAPLTGAGEHTAAVLTPPAPTGPWTLTVTSPPDGPWVLLQRLVFGTKEDARHVIGAEGGTSLGIAASGDSTYAAPPPALGPLSAPTTLAAATPDAIDLQQYDIRALGLPNTRLLYRVASVAGCSPIRVTSTGQPLPFVVTAAAIEPTGGYAHVGDDLLVSPGATDLAVSLEPTRKCRALRWLYPGDALTLTASPAVLAGLHASPTHLSIGGAAVIEGPTDAVAQVRLYTGETLRLDTTFPLATLNQAPPSWVLEPPLDIDSAPVRLEIHTPSDAPWVLLSTATLSEPGITGLP